jgi:hypothetical protein
MSNWNMNFTTLLRDDRANFWGNWSLDSSIQPGAVGTLDPQTGTFSLVSGEIPGAKIASKSLSQDWDLESSEITQSKAEVNLDGSATDPKTGTKVTAGVRSTWSFAKKGSLISKFATTRQASLKDFAGLIKEQMSWLQEQASRVNMNTPYGISQGFCVVTDVIYASSGMNVGAKNNDSSFTIEGSATGIDAMTDSSASGKASYTSISQTKSMDKHIWPSKSNQIADSEVVVAYVVTSFDGSLVLPNWTHMISSFELTLDNQHGGTYIAHGKVTYRVGDKKFTKTHSASGGLKNTIADIPVSAEDLDYWVTFTASKTRKHFAWGSPLMQWPKGYRRVEIRGVWPWAPKAVDRGG